MRDSIRSGSVDWTNFWVFPWILTASPISAKERCVCSWVAAVTFCAEAEAARSKYASPRTAAIVMATDAATTKIMRRAIPLLVIFFKLRGVRRNLPCRFPPLAQLVYAQADDDGADGLLAVEHGQAYLDELLAGR